MSSPATFYSPGGEVGACGTAIQNSDLSVALSTEDFSSELCGTEFIVEYNGQGVAVAVADICTACGKGNIDLTTGAYEILAPLDTGAIEVTYEL
ncbi:hypothetical protein B0H10DRAFT_2435254 [Mycena sp. CBHHK59/15]|nr:hypothetical protein B0H10DRAFT_2435254 [Mycena sp. CBHHK59/15]